MGEAHGLRRGVLDGDHVEEAAGAAEERRDREGHHLVAVGRDAHRGRDRLVVADDRHRAAELAPHEVAREQERDHGDRQHDVVLPLVVVEAAPVGRAREPCRRALRAAGELVEPLGEGEPHDGQGDRHHRDREPAQASGREGDDQPRDARDQAGEHEDDRDVPAGVHPVGGDVGAEAEEEDLPQRHLAGVAHDDVQAQHGDGVDADADEGLVGEDRKHQRRGEQQGREHHEQSAHDPGIAERAGEVRHQTRTTTFRPKSPCGRRMRTTKTRMNGTAIFRS